ncbi:MAG: biotin--[acetyl-CoA-carboxylase] ligase, partial [Isosphaeraceae bacterium]
SERLCPDQIEEGLNASRIGRRIAVWNRVASTNDLAARAANSTANEGLVILAEEQSAGRGRRGRSWSAPARRSILMSVLLFPPEPLADAAWLTALGAVAVAQVVELWTSHPARIKWPNDVRVDGRKIAGILVERGAGAVVGIGLNANLAADDLPPELAGSATSLQILLGRTVDRSDLARDLIRTLDALYSTARVEGPRPLTEHWRERCEHLDQWVAVETATRRISGRLADLDLLGDARLVTLDDGPLPIPTREILAIHPSLDSETDPSSAGG